ncbi:MAG: hypothetical protein JW904_06240 [Spirochaetales bacterium]|nr:hypothetical protein [Spirochaetales bacterium]
MDEIKSAWEIALERTKEIKTDRKALEEKELVTEGKKIASQYLDEAEMQEISVAIKKIEAKSKKFVIKGITNALLANYVLPLNEYAQARNSRVKEALKVISGKSPAVESLLGQIDGFFDNYTNERSQIESSLEKQYAPRLRQKEAALAQQMGQPVELKAAQDPEFIGLLKKNLGMYDEKYQQVLNQAKEEILRILGETM